MGLGTCMLSLMVVILITGVQSADKALGADCTAGTDTCTDTSTTCTSGKCLIKVDQDCNDNTDKCVTGATCTGTTDKKCKCGTDYTADTASGLCMIKVDKDCEDNTDKCVTGATCTGTTDKKCECGTDYTADTASGLCNKNLDQPCTPSDTCVTNTACSSGKCLIKAGEDCTGKTDKCVTQATCGSADNKCACNTGYTADATSGLCKKNLGVACEQDTECSDGTKTFCDKVAKKCLLKPAQSCADNTDKCSSGAACTTDTCTCDTDLTTAGADKCTPKANKVGGSCTDTCDDSNAECTDSVCVCKKNFSVNKQSLTCSSKAGAVVASMTLMLVATLTGLFLTAH